MSARARQPAAVARESSADDAPPGDSLARDPLGRGRSSPVPSRPDHFIATPRAGAGSGVLVLHAWWGLTPFFASLCRRLAEQGFVALAPDLYRGHGVAATVDAVRALRARAGARQREPIYRFLMREIDHLRAHPAVNASRIAVLGCSMGGHWAYWLSQRADLPIERTVTFYAARAGDFSATRSRFLCHFAETDEWVSDAARRRLARAFERADVSAGIHVYPGTRHGFFERDRPEAFAPSAARTAWTRTLAFLRDSAVQAA